MHPTQHPNAPGTGHREAASDSPIDLRHTTTRSVAVLGAGGHGREIADIVRARAAVDGSVRLVGIADDGEPDLALLGRSGIPYLGTSTALNDSSLAVLLGVGMPSVRRDLAREFTAAPALLHPSAMVGSACALGRGVVLAQGVIVTTNVTIGRHTHINIGATISHDCVVGSFVTICPGVSLTGDVTVDDGCFIGAGATVLPGVHIGRNAVVGAGAVVTSDVAPRERVAGLPARPL